MSLSYDNTLYQCLYVSVYACMCKHIHTCVCVHTYTPALSCHTPHNQEGRLSLWYVRRDYLLCPTCFILLLKHCDTWPLPDCRWGQQTPIVVKSEMRSRSIKEWKKKPACCSSCSSNNNSSSSNADMEWLYVNVRGWSEWARERSSEFNGFQARLRIVCSGYIDSDGIGAGGDSQQDSDSSHTHL